jgi:DNA invertase Pin-like site-specific DNA recombinase
MADTKQHLVGYARVSTDDQKLDLQIAALTNAGVREEDIYTDVASGAAGKKRPGLAAAFKDLREGDVLVVWKLDRLGRNLAELIQTINRVREKGANFRCLTQQIDTTTPMGVLIFHIFGAIAEFERELIRERTIAGLAVAAAQGRKGGRRPVLHEEARAKVRRLLAEGKSVAQVAKATKISPTTIYKWKAAVEPDPMVHDPMTDEVRGDD